MIVAGEVVSLSDGVRRITAPNPGPMTGAGTNTYLLGCEQVAVVDPGPAHSGHIDRVLAEVAAQGGRVHRILVTHTHPDHSPGAALLKQRTDAPTFGMSPPDDGHQDLSFKPDCILSDGQHLSSGEYNLTAVHTPGHASNHVCYLHRESRLLMTGDHVMNGSTVVILPPDGRMAHYLQSLRKIRALDVAAIAPGHGELLHEPVAAVDWIIDHRLEREAKVLNALSDDTLDTLVEKVYNDVPRHLYPLAKRSLLAHLIKLQDEGLASLQGERWQRCTRFSNGAQERT